MMLRYAASFTLALSLFSHAQSLVRGNPAKPCYPGICKLPDCFCSGTEIPGNLSVSSIPQIVFVSFDAFVSSAPLFFYETLFDGSLKNPNGCNISATFFVSHEYTNCCEIQDLYSQRHEIGHNSISCLLPSSWWANATQEGQREEILGMRDILRKWGNVSEDVKGYRAPYIQVGGNMEFKVLEDEGFLYESSMPTQKFTDPPLWPYTLDYRSSQDCQIPPCPNGMCAS